MKVLKTIVIVACILALAGLADAGSRPYTGPRPGGGHGHPSVGWGGHGGYRPPHRPSYWGPSGWRPSGWTVYVSSDDWSYTYWGGYTVGTGWTSGYTYPYTWSPRPTVYYRTRTVPVLVGPPPVVYDRVRVVEVASPEPVLLPEPETSPVRVIEPVAPRELTRIGAVLRNGDVARAESDLRKLLLKHPSDAQIHCVYGYTLFLREKYTAASFVLRRALVLDGRLVAAGRMVVEGFYDGEQAARGLARLNRHIDEHADETTPRLLRAYLHFLSGDREAARTDLDVLLKEDANDAQAAFLRLVCTD